MLDCVWVFSRGAGVRVNFLVVIVIIVTRWHLECGDQCLHCLGHDTCYCSQRPGRVIPQLLTRITRLQLSLWAETWVNPDHLLDLWRCGYFVLQFWWQSCVHSNEFTINLASCNIATSLIRGSLFASWYDHHHHYFKSFTKAKTLTPVKRSFYHKKCTGSQSTGQWAIWWGWVY